MRNKVDKLDVDKLVSVLVDLSILSDIVHSDVVKKMYIMLRSKILKTKYLILLTAPSTILNTKINEVKNEILSITNLAMLLLMLKYRLKVKYLVLLT